MPIEEAFVPFICITNQYQVEILPKSRLEMPWIARARALEQLSLE
jgi:hypothetical protein